MVKHTYLYSHPYEARTETDAQELSVLLETARLGLRASFWNQVPSGQDTMGIQR